VRHDEVLDPSGKPGVYGVVSPRNFALGVVPFFDDGTVILVGQYRYALDRYSWEIPEGGGLKAASREESIARELREETGFAASTWFPVIENATLSNSITDESVYCWAAWGLTSGDTELESTEHDLVAWRVPFVNVVSMVWGHEIHDSLTIMTVSRIEAMRLRHELPTELQEILR
jgi:8-oxo-dGTP pyrophosphatase MutT (NUDIX family)